VDLQVPHTKGQFFIRPQAVTLTSSIFDLNLVGPLPLGVNQKWESFRNRHHNLPAMANSQGLPTGHYDLFDLLIEQVQAGKQCVGGTRHPASDRHGRAAYIDRYAVVSFIG
jgi:hypothetical protein